MISLDVAGEQLELRGDRTIHWRSQQALLLADPHFGKANTFRSAGLPIPGHATGSLKILSDALTATRAQRLLILGDFWHHRSGCTPDLLLELALWRTQHTSLAIDLIRGNHDRTAVPESWADGWTAEPCQLGPFVFQHYPANRDDGYVLAGHLHPGCRISGRGRQSITLPCYHITPGCMILPAFGALTGLHIVNPMPGDRLVAIAHGEVIEVPVL